MMKFNIKSSLCWLTLGLPLLFTGCQSTQLQVAASSPSSLLVLNETFDGELAPIETPEQIFALPDDAKVQLHKLVSNYRTMPERTKAVLNFIISYADDGLVYDNSTTRTATDTLKYSRANCLSLSILAYSLAQEVGMDATFQDVLIPEYWTSEMNQSWLNGHVNLRLKHQRQVDGAIGVVLLGSDVIVDFDPYSLKQQFQTDPISQQRVVAMFYNNKAAVAFSQGNDAQTYAYYQAAIAADPSFAVTWSNLGVLYRSHGMLELAEKTYLHSLSLNKTSINTLSNLAYLYRLTNRNRKAQELERTVYNRRKDNPYYYLMLGTEAFNRRQLLDAVEQFEQALALDKNNHEAYFGLAKTYYLLDKPLQASRYLEKARSVANSRQDKARYQHKLAILNQVAKN